MPPWVVSVPRLTICSRARAIDLSTALLRSRHATAANSLVTKLRARPASTHVSPTAINYRPNIPRRNKELHDALSALDGAAEQYVNLSRLQLALGGLVTENAVTRVAVLGLNGHAGAQRLARLLIADPLAEEGEWEKELENGTDEGIVLLRFGDEVDPNASSPLYRVLSVPSRVLGKHNLEILVSTLNTNIPTVSTPSATENPKDSLLVPKLQATSARGTPVPYPVHKTLLAGEGLDSAIAYGNFASDMAEDLGHMVKVAVDLPAPLGEQEAAKDRVTVATNVAIATQGLRAIRTSVANSMTYERDWFASGLPSLSNWLVSDLQPDEPMKTAHKDLIASLLDDVEANISKEDAQRLTQLSSSTTQDQLNAEMIGYLEQWAERSHRELRDSLDEAFASKSWRKLAWWKLLWRVDDVAMIMEDVLARRWLVSAEQDGVYLAGRMKQARFSDELRLPLPTDTAEAIATPITPEASNSGTEVSTANVVPLYAQTTTSLSTTVAQPTPWPALISSSRKTLLSTTLPPMQALAQRLLLTTFSTTSISAALSALLYASVSSVSIFEASAIAALGLTFSLRRMQTSWEDARTAWSAKVREEGRQAIKTTEGVVRSIVGSTKGEEVVDDKVEERRLAREAVAKAREALAKVGSKEGQ